MSDPVVKLQEHDLPKVMAAALSAYDVWGVYIIRAADPESKTGWKTIERLLGNDDSGCLYIGAGHLIGRVCEASKAVRPGYRTKFNHPFIAYTKNPKITEAFPPHTLQVELKRCDDPDHWKVESALLHEYRLRYGELPPFNSRS